MPIRHDARSVRRLLKVVLRRFVVLLAVGPMLMVLLATAPGIRLALRDAKLPAVSALGAFTAQSHAERNEKESDDRRRPHLASTGLESAGEDDTDAEESSETSETGDSNEPSDQDGDGDGDGDEMIVWQPDRIPGACLVALLSHETPKLSGVTHSPEPRPARSA